MRPVPMVTLPFSLSFTASFIARASVARLLPTAPPDLPTRASSALMATLMCASLLATPANFDMGISTRRNSPRYGQFQQ